MFGQVVQVKNAVASATPSVGAVIRTGSLIQSLGTDSAGNVWVSAPTISDFSIEPNPIYVIKNGASSATAVVGLSFLGGSIPVLTGMLYPSSSHAIIHVHVLYESSTFLALFIICFCCLTFLIPTLLNPMSTLEKVGSSLDEWFT